MKSYIFYCIDCKKFHFSEIEEYQAIRRCPHCSYTYSLNTGYEKDEYEQMDENSKEEFKNKIRKKFPSENRNEILKKYLDEYNESERRRKGIIYDLVGCRGRSIVVYDNRCVIMTDVTLGSVMTGNALDGEKTIFYKDVVGVQFKEAGFTIGYLQLETSSIQMNNKDSNAFSENTFTFDCIGTEYSNKDIIKVKEYIVNQILKYKQLPSNIDVKCISLSSVCDLYEKQLLTKEEFEKLKEKIIKE